MGEALAQEPVTKNASPEARALLKFFYSISGEYILTGQHNFPNVQGKNTAFASRYIGKTPVIYSTDWGFAFGGSYDSYLARRDIVNEAIEQYKRGAIVTICWHAVPPTSDEPVTFQPAPGDDSTKLHSVSGHLLDQQFQEVLTPGTELYQHWCRQVDTIAFYLKKLQDAHVPIIWRPYHEMNGEWFWWGGRQGEYSTIRLYRQLFDRLVNVHKLNNLIWMWNVDRPSTPARKFSHFFVGSAYFDIASLDVYGSDFKQSYYDSLLFLAGGKPVTFGEVGNPPSPEILKRQPRWAYYVIWATMARYTTRKQYDLLKSDSRVLFLEDTAYRIARENSGLPYGLTRRIPDYSGEWVLDEDQSSLDDRGTAFLPARIDVRQTEDSIDILQTIPSEYEKNTIQTIALSLNGQERPFPSPFGGSPGSISARLGPATDTLTIISRIRNARTIETWTLREAGHLLAITQASEMFGGRRTIISIYKRVF